MIRIQYNEPHNAAPRYNVLDSRDDQPPTELGYVEVYSYPDNCAGFITSFSNDGQMATTPRKAVEDVPLDRALNVVISGEDTPVAMT